MSTASKIREQIRELGANAIFVSKQFLHLGTRNAVDLTLSRLEKKGRILRLAVGVFIAVSSDLKLPSALEIAQTKAAIYGKQISYERELQKETRKFCTNGCSSSFQTVHGRVYFKPISPAKHSKFSLLTKPIEQNIPVARDNDLATESSVTLHSQAFSLSHSNRQSLICLETRRCLRHFAMPSPGQKSSAITIAEEGKPIRIGFAKIIEAVISQLWSALCAQQFAA